MEYRAGPKSTGDKIRQCLHNSLPKKINDTSPILSHYMTHAHAHAHAHTATVTKVHCTFSCDNIGLVSLIFLGRELCRHCLVLSPVLFGPALYSIFKIYQFLIYFIYIYHCNNVMVTLTQNLLLQLHFMCRCHSLRL